MREITLDTETTGFDPGEKHRIVEIGCVELKNRIPTGRTFHAYLNPDRDMPEAAFKVHGISAGFLADKPRFREVADDFLSFIGGDKLVIHNAEFDLRFLNAELRWTGRETLSPDRAFCTLHYARRKFPGLPNNLDALCKRLNVDTSARDKHGALLDAQLLAALYLELMGGSQNALVFEGSRKPEAGNQKPENIDSGGENVRVLPARPHAPTAAELEAHAAFVKKLKGGGGW